MRFAKQYRRNKRVLWKKGETGQSNAQCMKYRSEYAIKTPKFSVRINPPNQESITQKLDDCHSVYSNQSIASIISTSSNPIFGDLASEPINELMHSEYKQRRQSLLTSMVSAVNFNENSTVCNQYYTILIKLLKSGEAKNNGMLDVASDLLCRIVTRGLSFGVLQRISCQAIPVILDVLKSNPSTNNKSGSENKITLTVNRFLAEALGHFMNVGTPPSVWHSSNSSHLLESVHCLVSLSLCRTAQSVRLAAQSALADLLLRHFSSSSFHEKECGLERALIDVLSAHRREASAVGQDSDLDVMYILQLLSASWPGLVQPGASRPLLALAVDDLLLNWFRLFHQSSKMRSHCLHALQSLYAAVQGSSSCVLTASQMQLASDSVLTARLDLVSWLLRPSSLSTSSSANSQDAGVISALRLWMKTASGLVHCCQSMRTLGDKDEEDRRLIGDVGERLLDQLMELSLEWILLDQNHRVEDVILEELHLCFAPEKLKNFSIPIGKNLFNQVTRALSVLDYEAHYVTLVGLADILLHWTFSSGSQHLDLMVSLKELLTAAVRLFKSTPIHDDKQSGHNSQTALNGKLEKLIGGVIQLFGGHWLLETGLGIDVFQQLRDHGRLSCAWILPLLSKYASHSSSLAYFRRSLLPSLWSFHTILAENRSRISTLMTSDSRQSSSRADNLQSKSARPTRRSSVSSNSSSCFSSDLIHEGTMDVDRIEASEEDLLTSHQAAERDQLLHLEQSFNNIAALCRHLWSGLVSFCRQPVDLEPIDREPCQLLDCLLTGVKRFTCPAQQADCQLASDSFSQFVPYIFQSVEALCRSAQENNLSANPLWQEAVSGWLDLLQGNRSVVPTLIESLLCQLASNCTPEEQQKMIGQIIVRLRQQKFDDYLQAECRALVPLMSWTQRELLLKCCIIKMKKVCTNVESNINLAANVKEQRCILRVLECLMLTCSQSEDSMGNNLLSVGANLLHESQQVGCAQSVSKARLRCWRVLIGQNSDVCNSPITTFWQSALAEILSSLSAESARTRALAANLLLPLFDRLERLGGADLVQRLLTSLNECAVNAAPAAATVVEDSSVEAAETVQCPLCTSSWHLKQRQSAVECVRLLVLGGSSSPAPPAPHAVDEQLDTCSIQSEAEEEKMESGRPDQLQQDVRAWPRAAVIQAVQLARELIVTCRHRERCVCSVHRRHTVRLGLLLAAVLFSKAANQAGARQVFLLQDQMLIVKSLDDGMLRALRMDVKMILKKIIGRYSYELFQKATRNVSLLKLARSIHKEKKRSMKKK